MTKKVCLLEKNTKEEPVFYEKKVALKTGSSPLLKELSSLEQEIKNNALKAGYSKKESFLKLIKIQELALSMEPKPDFTAALKSEELKGKLFGLYQDKKQEEEGSVQVYPTALVEWV